ncbi:MAG: lactate utilization protein C [Opitutales bacterium]
MSDDRSQILRSIREALQPIPAERLTAYPEWDTTSTRMAVYPDLGSPWEVFSFKLKQVNGTPLNDLGALSRWMEAEGLKFGYCDPALLKLLEDFGGFDGVTFETEFDLAKVDDYAFGITRAAGAIAETGTVILKDSVTSARLAALAPWTHIALLEMDDLVEYVDQAVTRLGDDPSVIWATGPSKTADVEGILIEGVHGPGIQVVCPLK